MENEKNMKEINKKLTREERLFTMYKAKKKSNDNTIPSFIIKSVDSKDKITSQYKTRKW